MKKEPRKKIKLKNLQEELQRWKEGSAAIEKLYSQEVAELKKQLAAVCK